MIDAHVHAFPTLAQQTSRAASALEGLTQFAQAAAPEVVKRARGLAGTAVSSLAEALPDLPLDLEKISLLRRYAPTTFNKALEYTMSLGLSPQVFLRGTFEHLEASMRASGVERAIVIGGGPIAPNDWLLEQCAKDPRRFIAVPTLPQLDRNASEDAWHAAYLSLAARGARGFKIHPNGDGLSPGHPAYRALFEVAKEKKRFVILHTGCFCVMGYKNLQPADPREFLPLLQAYPEVKVCLAHMNRDEPEVCWDLMRRHPQLFTDTSWQPEAVVRQALREVSADRVLLGSDWPLLHRRLQGEAVDIARAAAPSSEALEQLSVRAVRAFIGES